MKDFSKNFIYLNKSIIDAMKMLDDIPESLTLFVVDKNEKLLGTLTDGDIRRGFIKGMTRKHKVSEFMFTRFHSVTDNVSVQDFKTARELGIRLLPVLNQKGQVEKIIDVKKRKSILPLEAMIMAGGRGERLQPLTNKTPKPMLPLGDKPILEHIIDRLIEYGITKIYISVKYLAEQIIDYFGDGSSKGISIEYILEDQPLGTAGALSKIKNIKTEHILLMNSDLFTDANFEDIYLNVIKRQALLGVATIPYTTKVPYGIFMIDNDRVIGIKEKPTYTSYANAGIYIINKSIINKIPSNRYYNITDLMEDLIKLGLIVVHNPLVGYWIDIGQHQDYKNAQEIVKHLKK